MPPARHLQRPGPCPRRRRASAASGPRRFSKAVAQHGARGLRHAQDAPRWRTLWHGPRPPTARRQVFPAQRRPQPPHLRSGRAARAAPRTRPSLRSRRPRCPPNAPVPGAHLPGRVDGPQPDPRAQRMVDRQATHRGPARRVRLHPVRTNERVHQQLQLKLRERLAQAHPRPAAEAHQQRRLRTLLTARRVPTSRERTRAGPSTSPGRGVTGTACTSPPSRPAAGTRRT
jgi:hypothetical protein